TVRRYSIAVGPNEATVLDDGSQLEIRVQPYDRLLFDIAHVEISAGIQHHPVRGVIGAEIFDARAEDIWIKSGILQIGRGYAIKIMIRKRFVVKIGIVRSDRQTCRVLIEGGTILIDLGAADLEDIGLIRDHGAAAFEDLPCITGIQIDDDDAAFAGVADIRKILIAVHHYFVEIARVVGCSYQGIGANNSIRCQADLDELLTVGIDAHLIRGRGIYSPKIVFGVDIQSIYIDELGQTAIAEGKTVPGLAGIDGLTAGNFGEAIKIGRGPKGVAGK